MREVHEFGSLVVCVGWGILNGFRKHRCEANEKTKKRRKKDMEAMGQAKLQDIGGRIWD